MARRVADRIEFNRLSTMFDMRDARVTKMQMMDGRKFALIRLGRTCLRVRSWVAVAQFGI